MVQILSRGLALAAIFVVCGAARATSIINAPTSSIPIAAGWQARDCGVFRIRAPDETTLRRRDALGGSLVDRRFKLSYAVGATLTTAIGQEGQDYKEVMAVVGGRPAMLRTAEFPGQDEPYFLQLYVPQAVKLHGRWRGLEIHGWFANLERRWLGVHIVTAIEFGPRFDRPLQPIAPRRAPPVIEAVAP